MPDKVFIRGIPDSMWRAFKARASLDGHTVSKAIQLAIRSYLDGPSVRISSDDPWKGITALGESGAEDVSERHDHYLAEANKPEGSE